jgi:hypothetical protein
MGAETARVVACRDLLEDDAHGPLGVPRVCLVEADLAPHAVHPDSRDLIPSWARSEDTGQLAGVEGSNTQSSAVGILVAKKVGMSVIRLCSQAPKERERWREEERKGE